MSDVQLCLGATSEFTWRGKTYTLVPWDQFGIQKKFEAWLRQRGRDAAQEFMGQPGYSDALSAYQRDAAAGVYDWGGDSVWVRAVSGTVGVRHLLLLVLRVRQPETTAEEVQAMLTEQGEEISRKLQELVTDPNRLTPLAAGAI